MGNIYFVCVLLPYYTYSIIQMSKSIHRFIQLQRKCHLLAAFLLLCCILCTTLRFLAVVCLLQKLIFTVPHCVTLKQLKCNFITKTFFCLFPFLVPIGFTYHFPRLINGFILSGEDKPLSNQDKIYKIYKSSLGQLIKHSRIK